MDHKYYMSVVHLNESSNTYNEKAGMVASWLLHHDQYVKQYYREHYNRDVQVVTNKMMFDNS